MAVELSYEHYPWWAVTFIVVTICYYIISPWFSERMIPGYSKVPENVRVEWHTMTTSYLHAPVVTLLSLFVLMTDEAIYKDVAWGRSYISQIPIAITLGFITADFFIMLFNFPLKESKFYLLHHILTAIPFWSNITFGPLTYFAVFRILAEFSTPFVNLRWFLDVLGMKSSKAYVINGVLLMMAFFVARIATMPQYYHSIYHLLSSDLVYTIQWPFLLVWLGGSVGLDVLNLLWFKKIFRGAIKVITTTPAKEENGDIVRNRVKGE